MDNNPQLPGSDPAARNSAMGAAIFAGFAVVVVCRVVVHDGETRSPSTGQRVGGEAVFPALLAALFIYAGVYALVRRLSRRGEK
ncbi:MAG TPA: hypothetical protein VD997_16125 [Phycisphaerales bacterium]|nr:hypothetical protein [Phycisphaerales bacterium]